MGKVLGESRQTIWNWKTRGVPRGRVFELAAKTGVPENDLRDKAA